MLFSGTSLGSVVSMAAPAEPDVQWTGSEWTGQPTQFQVNREPAHTAFIPYDTEEKALARSEENSAYYQLLNGDVYKRQLHQRSIPPDASSQTSRLEPELPS